MGYVSSRMVGKVKRRDGVTLENPPPFVYPAVNGFVVPFVEIL